MRKTSLSAAVVATALAVATLGNSSVASAAPGKQEPKKPPTITWVCDKEAKPPAGWASSKACSEPGPLKYPCEKSYCKLIPKKS